ncbi:MAG: hypothetical protein IJS66_03215 [Bacteroidales bacterium]|nr:hypothetical protein [Bacteroidales bacterium]
MKALFISYNQAYNEEIVQILEDAGQRGFTRWEDIQGRGSRDGRPHLGSHAWPEQNHAILSVMEDNKAEEVLKSLKAKDLEAHDLGLRAFGWNVDFYY